MPVLETNIDSRNDAFRVNSETMASLVSELRHKLSEYLVFLPIPPSPPLGGEGRGEGERLRRSPLTLTLSPGGGEGIRNFYARS